MKKVQRRGKRGLGGKDQARSSENRLERPGSEGLGRKFREEVREAWKGRTMQEVQRKGKRGL